MSTFIDKKEVEGIAENTFEEEQIVEESDSSEVYREDDASEDFSNESSWVALLAVVTAGCAFISDGYQQGIMTTVNIALGKSYSEYSTGNWKTMVSNSNLVANVLGQIFFGLVVDRIGRRQGFALTTLFIIVGSIIAACSRGSSQSAIFWMLIIARGISGFGIGGEYPCSATSAMEAADERLGNRRKLIPFIFATNFPIALGLPLGSAVFLIVLSIWGEDHPTGIWRTCFGIGAVFPISIFIFRWRMRHAKVYKKNAIKRNVPYVLAFKRYWKSLLGVSSMWFIMDFVIYPNNIFSSSVISVVIPHASMRRTAEWELFLGSFAVFGSLSGMLLFRFMSRRAIIISGFLGYGIISIIVGAAFEKLVKIPALFIIFYALLNLIIYAGPCNLQSIISSESFPTFIRASFYGLSAAIGKAGAAIGTEVFTPIQTHAGKRYTFFLSGGLCFLGALVSWLWIPETTDYNLKEEDEKFNQYLRENGWTGSMGEGDQKHEFKA